MLVSSSEGFAREGLLAAILLRALIFAVVVMGDEILAANFLEVENVRRQKSSPIFWPITGYLITLPSRRRIAPSSARSSFEIRNAIKFVCGLQTGMNSSLIYSCYSATLIQSPSLAPLKIFRFFLIIL